MAEILTVGGYAVHVEDEAPKTKTPAKRKTAKAKPAAVKVTKRKGKG